MANAGGADGRVGGHDERRIRGSTRARARRSLGCGILGAALLGAAWAFVPHAGSATELRDAALVAAGRPVLQPAASTVRLEDARLGGLTGTFIVPEPGALWQLMAGAGLLTVLAGHRRARIRSEACEKEIQ